MNATPPPPPPVSVLLAPQPYNGHSQSRSYSLQPSYPIQDVQPSFLTHGGQPSYSQQPKSEQPDLSSMLSAQTLRRLLLQSPVPRPPLSVISRYNLRFSRLTLFPLQVPLLVLARQLNPKRANPNLSCATAEEEQQVFSTCSQANHTVWAIHFAWRHRG